jgi:hypothetical protein
MTATLWRLTVVAVVSVPALPVALIVAPGERSLIVRLELLLIAGCALAFMVQLVGRAAPRPAPSPLDRRRPVPSPRRRPPSTLSALDRRLTLATVHAGDAHHWVRPLVRQIAADRLPLRRGLEIDPVTPARMGQVKAILGPAAWELSRPAPRPEDPLAPGIPAADLEEAVTGLERI